ncbi:MAG: hypothetical protein FJ363_05755 [Gemmatimonadetes bacterium]|nr:hypothetical protein [Gemmatimonadota bacterium]
MRDNPVQGNGHRTMRRMHRDESAAAPRHGMALPMVIVVLLVLAASFAGGVALARGERALDDAGKSTLVAQSYAETGLERLTSDRGALGLSGMPGTSDSTRVTVSGGYYDVITTRLRPASGVTVPAIYYLRSHAVVTQSGVAGAPSAEYTVTALATWLNGTMTVQSALTGYNGTTKSGAAGAISGADECSVASGGTGDTLPAVAVPATASNGGSGYQGSTAPLVGDPLIQTIGATPAAAAASSPIDWPAIYDGTAIAPTFTSDWQGNGFPSQAWFAANPTTFPVIFIQNGPPNAGNEFVLGEFGRGMLIVQDDIRLNGNTAGWDGILLVGGRIRTNGSNRVSGATVAGLNTQLGVTSLPSDINDLNGTKAFLYNSCNVSQAVAGMGSLRVYKNTWTNNFKTY